MLKAFKERLERRPKPAPLYREVRNMPPPMEIGALPPGTEVNLLPGQIFFVDAGSDTRSIAAPDDPYEWFEPKR